MIYSRTIVIGDIHGCFYTLMDLLEKIEYKEAEDRLIFVGDYIDRGENSFEVLDFLFKLQKRVGKEAVVCLMGNHEDMMLYDKACWLNNGGNATRKSFYKHHFQPNVFNFWLKKLPLYFESEAYIVCHAGLPYAKLEDNSRDDILWDRDWLRYCHVETEKPVIFGHTITGTGEARIVYNGSIGIDTGCVSGGRLCACIINDEENLQPEFVYTEKNKLD